MKKILFLVVLTACFTANSQMLSSEIDSFLKGSFKCCTSSTASSVDSQSLSIVGNVLTISRGNSVTLPTSGGSSTIYVDSVSSNTAGDSLIVFKNGVRKAYKYPTSSGGGGSTTIVSSDGSLIVNPTSTGFDIINESGGINAPAAQSLTVNLVGGSVINMTATRTNVPLSNVVANTFSNGSTYNTATGIFTAGVTGNYFISYALRYDNAVHTANAWYLAGLTVNGVLISTMTAQNDVTLTNSLQIPNTSLMLTLNAGDTVAVQGQHIDSGNKALQPARGCFLNIALMSVE